jgi:hypothetical protein
VIQTDNLFLTREYTKPAIDSIVIKCPDYYTVMDDNFEFQKSGINYYPIMLSKAVKYGKPQKSDIAAIEIGDNYILKLKNLTFPDSIRNNPVFFRDIDLDKSNSLLVVDAQNNRILNSEIDFGDFDSPEGIAVDSEGKIYVADWGNHRVLVFNENGTCIDTLGQFGKNRNSNAGRKGRLVLPTRVAVEEEDGPVEVFLQGSARNLYKRKHILISDWFGVHKFDQYGYYLDTVIQSPSPWPEGSFYGVAVRGYGKDSEIYAVNRENGKVERIAGR